MSTRVVLVPVFPCVISTPNNYASFLEKTFSGVESEIVCAYALRTIKQQFADPILKDNAPASFRSIPVPKKIGTGKGKKF